jgi:mitochondrial fission protein ELM1
VYQKNPHGDVWYGLEESADEAAFRAFSMDRPSQGFSALRKGTAGKSVAVQQPDIAPVASVSGEDGNLVRLLQETGANTFLHCRIAACSDGAAIPVSGLGGSVETMDPTVDPAGSRSEREFDAVLCSDTLEFVPDDDIPWLLDRLFCCAKQFLFCRVDAGRGAAQPWKRTMDWWHYQFQTVARHHPGVRWQLQLKRPGAFWRNRTVTLGGNESARRELSIWVINGRKLGHSSQSNAIAEVLEWPYQRKEVQQRFARQLAVLFHLGLRQIGECKPPWPDVVIACGWWPCHLARWIKSRSGGRTRLLLAGRKSQGVRSCIDIVVCCEHFHLPAHRRRIETLLPVHPLTHQRMEEARQRGERLFGSAARPRVAMLVGGDSKQHSFSAQDASAMGQKVLEQVKQLGGSLFVVTARRTSKDAAEALAEVLRDEAHLHVWSAGARDNPYLEYLAAADILVVSGESESMLTDAIATSKPVYIYPLRQRPLEPMMALGQWLLDRTSRRPRNRRGTERPQQGFEYLCARVLHSEWILPPRDLEGLHHHLVERGYAARFGKSLQTTRQGPKYQQEDLRNRLRIMLDQPADGMDAGIKAAVGQQRAGGA